MTCTLTTSYPIPADEPLRLRDLERHAVIGEASDPHFERLVDLAASLFEAPMVAISLVDAERQWFLASRGLGGLRETPRSTAFCAHAIAGNGVMVVPDALSDERFRANPLVQGRPHIRFYAGAPLRSPDGHNLGTLCVLDTTPRPPLEPERLQQLQWLADLVMRELELRRLPLHCPITGLPIRRAAPSAARPAEGQASAKPGVPPAAGGGSDRTCSSRVPRSAKCTATVCSTGSVPVEKSTPVTSRPASLAAAMKAPLRGRGRAGAHAVRAQGGVVPGGGGGGTRAQAPGRRHGGGGPGVQ
jgi:hypothetical protein